MTVITFRNEIPAGRRTPLYVANIRGGKAHASQIHCYNLATKSARFQQQKCLLVGLIK